MKRNSWQVGDWVIYRKQKRSNIPGPRAEAIHPDAHGENYSYIVEKHWVIQEIKVSGELVLITRRGKQHTISPGDERLHSLNWWQRRKLMKRFHEVERTLRQKKAAVEN